MKDEKKVKATEEETKKKVQTEEEGVQLTDEELSSVAAGREPPELVIKIPTGKPDQPAEVVK